MLLSDFDFDLPDDLIAQKPIAVRDRSRMMVLDRAAGEITHSSFMNITDHLDKGSVLVLNDSRVIPAKLIGKKKDAEIEFLLLEEGEKGIWRVLCRPAKKVCLGDMIVFSAALKGEIVEVGEEGQRKLNFKKTDVLSEIQKIGYAPLPPYIKRLKSQTDLREFDRKRYQTVFANNPGSIAVPTAGLHFTPGILRRIEKKGVKVVPVTLDVGLATFQPVRAKRIERHVMLSESFFISENTARTVNKAKKENNPVTAVGTTSVRALETAFHNGRVLPGPRKSRLFIYPGYEFRVPDRILTNFHLPRSTLLMLVSAFAGPDLIKKAYKEAVSEKYRFFSYGDCMLII